MKFLMYSTSGEGAGILYRIKQEGNECKIFIKDKIYKTVYDGLLDKVDNPDSFVDSSTMIIFDISGNGDAADYYRKKGNLVYGASSFCDKLEQDRKFGFDIMKRAGIKIPESKEFTNFNAGRQYVQEMNKKLVFKPSGSMPCKLTYCSDSLEELIKYLEFVEKQFGSDIDSFVLQDFIEGVVVSSEFFCDVNGFLWPPNHTVEDKKFMNDGLSTSTGCSGNITWPCEEDKIIGDGVLLMEDICRDNVLVGQIDVNCVVTETGDVYGLEFTPRFGYDATPTLVSLLDHELGQFFSDMCTGDLEGIEMNTAYAGSIRITVPPYPTESDVDPADYSPNMGIPILKLDTDSCNLYEVMCKDGQLVHSGGSGVVACAIGIGSYKSCLDKPYEIAEDAVIPDKQYRTDLKEVLPKMVREVEQYA